MQNGSVSSEATLATKALAEVLHADLTLQYGPLLPSAALVKVLGYASSNAFRQAAFRGATPVATFRIPHRRGRFALARDVATWLAQSRLEARQFAAQPADTLNQPLAADRVS